MLFLRTSSLQGEKILFSLKLILLKMFFPLPRKLFGPPGLPWKRTPCTAMAKSITTTTTLIALLLIHQQHIGIYSIRLYWTTCYCFAFWTSLSFHCTRKLSPNLHLVSSWIITRTDVKICHMSEIKDLVRFRVSIGEHQDTTREAPALSRASSVVVVASPTSGREATT